MDATVTLQELVYSGYLSHGAFVFGNETENIQHNDGNIAKDIEGRQQILNSAKISLMLTKKISESIQNENDEKKENNNSQTSLRLKNILVKLSKRCPEVGHAAGSDATQNKYPDETTNNNTYPHTQAENSSQILSSKNNELGESTIDDSIRSDSSSVMIEGFLSEVEWPAVNTNGRDEKKHYENEGEVNPPPDSILDFFGTISHCSDTADPNNYEPCTDGGVNEQLKTSTHGTRWILLGMEINAPDDVLDTAQTSVQDSMYDLPMQILGNIFYSIFSLDKEQLFQSFRKEELACSRIIEVNDDFDESSPRISKNRRNADTSLFSHLLESGKCPISVCRLISDMIDADGDGDSKADSPVNSLDEVIQDLEQMINYVSCWHITIICQNSTHSIF